MCLALAPNLTLGRSTETNGYGNAHPKQQLVYALEPDIRRVSAADTKKSDVMDLGEVSTRKRMAKCQIVSEVAAGPVPCGQFAYLPKYHITIKSCRLKHLSSFVATKSFDLQNITFKRCPTKVRCRKTCSRHSASFTVGAMKGVGGCFAVSPRGIINKCCALSMHVLDFFFALSLE